MKLESAGGLVQLICSPIGNLGDFTFRAVDCLKKADLIACEDTRHSKRLFGHYQIVFQELVSLHEHNETQRAGQLARRIQERNEVLALLSDAGSPSISDPGFRLVQECIRLGIKVEVIPGPSAVVTGLIGSGLPTDKFYFGGFLPVKSGKKETVLTQALNSEATSIFFESPHRIVKTIETLQRLDSDRQLCVARELTKKFETYHRGTAEEILKDFAESTVKGEITLLIGGLSRSDRKKGRSDG